MTFEEIITQAVIESIKELYHSDTDAESVTLQKTKKEFEGDFTLVVFPFLKVSRCKPEDTARQIGEKLMEKLGVSSKEISIKKAVEQHFRDIGQKSGVFDSAFDNAQARERTQVLMDVANQTKGLVVGTGDLSEAALGWATFGGDHLSMYNVNCGVPKTLVRAVVEWYADNSSAGLKKVLLDILATPVSPELLPSDGKDIAQKTEELIGPYELHDFFLFHAVRRGAPPKKLLFLARRVFKGRYTDALKVKCLKLFISRFQGQHFKRSCSPDGVGTGSVSLSPRAGMRLPSDAFSSSWLEEL